MEPREVTLSPSTVILRINWGDQDCRLLSPPTCTTRTAESEALKVGPRDSCPCSCALKCVNPSRLDEGVLLWSQNWKPLPPTHEPTPLIVKPLL